jgi:23S rRNA (cytosine1962-C5)-methyltransferase
MSLARVVVKPRRSRPFFARHPWLFAGSIARVEGQPEPGDEVDVVSHENIFIARGLFNPRSAIRVRLYRWEPEPLDLPFWRERIESALRLRIETLGLIAPGTACRLVFSESDGLSGLIVDRFDRWIVAQFTSLSLASRRDVLLPILAELTGCEGIWLRTDRAMAEHEGLEIEESLAFGSAPPEPIPINEGGITYLVDLRGGQKTGFYLDQRDNRLALSRYARGRRVLDLFCYTGGFSLNALMPGGAEHALGFDSSGPAIELARRNAVQNGLGAARFEQADAFEALETLRASHRQFGLVVCDPPKFARSPKDLDDAVRGYLRLNRLALDVVEPGGIFATCSCSGLVDRTMFADLLARVAELSGRPIQILEQRGQAPDHPVLASCLETDYLKCFICRVL